MRTIQVTNGFNDYAVGRLRETRKKSLALTQIRVALISSVATAIPGVESEEWREADELEFLQPHDVRVSLLVDDRYEVGSYYLWALPIDNPTATPVKAGNHMIVVV